MREQLGAIALLIAVGSGALAVGAGLDRDLSGRDSSSELLYLPNGKHLKLASLGHASFVADMIYLWAIQYYANYERADRYQYVEHVFSDVIAELDPQYIDAYWVGALILSLEARDLEAALRVLDKGIENNPDSWLLPYLAAWECHSRGEFGRARSYFDRAYVVPGAPPVVRRLRAGFAKLAGEPREALQLWREISEDPESDPESVAIAERKVKELRVRVDLEELQAAVERFRNDNGHWPQALEVLIRRGYIDFVPEDPEGRPYGYDPASGTVSSAAGRILGES